MKGVVQMLAVNDTLDYLTAEIYEQMKKKRNIWARTIDFPPVKSVLSGKSNVTASGYKIIQ